MNRSRLLRTALALVATVVVVPVVPGLSSERPSVDARSPGMTTDPAPPNIAVVDHPDRADVKFIKFYSALLGRETTTKVLLPPHYSTDGDAVPTLYFLHGTCDIASLDQMPEPVPLDYPLGPCGGGINSWGGGPWFAEPSARIGFLVVFPDVGSNGAWCGHCWWVDGRNGKGVAAESHLYRELIPAIEHTFNVQQGRNGRAMSGKSMGANGALLHAFRHPDWWRFALAFSPTEPGRHSLETPNNTFAWAEYLTDQGYGPPSTDQVAYENIEPAYLTHHVIGTGLEVIVDIGDGCVTPSDDPACAGGSQNDEFRFRAAKDVWVSQLIERGVDLTYVPRPGTHGTGQGPAYRRFFADRVNRMFAEPAPTPEVFAHSTVDTSAAIWGWDVAMDRPTQEFLHLSGARTDGSALTLAGTGRVTVTTPPMHGPAARYVVEAVADGVELPSTPPVEVLAGNRLRFTLDLGTRDPAIDQRRELVENGRYQFPRTRVRIVRVGD